MVFCLHDWTIIAQPVIVEVSSKKKNNNCFRKCLIRWLKLAPLF